MADTPEPLGAALADRYTIERELGSGGMATVYLAHDLRHGRQVAIKVLRPELAAILGAERFLREIQIAAQLNHPHILGLIDSGAVPSEDGNPSGRPYYVMPYVEGESLRARLEREPQLPLEDALLIAREVADALGYAHSRGIVHRDIKPENILLSGGHAVVADFGIARAIGTSGGTKLTETGMALGTPAYMSPEQSLAQEVDGRTDIYALGCVLYETLVGEAPYTGPTAQAIIARRLSEPLPSVRVVRDAVPLAVEMAIHKALARTPADRFVTASRFVEALTAPVGDVAPRTRVLPRSRRARMALVGAVAVIVGAGAWVTLRLRGPAVPTSASMIAVLPIFTGGTDTALTRMAEDLVVLLSNDLDGVGGIRTVDPRTILTGPEDYSQSALYPDNATRIGRRLGAGSVVSGSLVRVGPDVRLDLQLLATDSASRDAEPLARTSVAKPADSLTALVDTATFGLLHQIWRHGEPPTPSVASITTHNVVALRAFLQGEQLSIAGHWPKAVAAFAAAFKEDSTFWLAAWRYNEGQSWVPGEPDVDTALQHKYEGHLSSFGERDRMLINGEKTSVYEAFDAHLARFRAVTNRFPADWAAWWPYADHLVHQAPLAGHTKAEALTALQRTLTLNPNLVNAWDHLFGVSLGMDSAETARALSHLMELVFRPLTAASGKDYSRHIRLLVQASTGHLPQEIVDSLIGGLPPSAPAYGSSSTFLASSGFPQAQIAFNRSLAAHDRAHHFAAPILLGSAFAWADRGGWDSALVALDAYGAAAGDQAPGVTIYQLLVAGARLGGLDSISASEHRPAALRDLAARAHPEDAAGARAALAWSDGMMAFLRHDSAALTSARGMVRASGDSGAPFLDRSLAASQLELRGAIRAAADSFASFDSTASHDSIDLRRDPYARSLDHLEGARLSLQLGDTSRAQRLLTWHEAGTGDGAIFQLFAPMAYLQLARIADAQGRTAEAREDYHQFLRRYDLPVPALKSLVDEANAALKRLSGQRDVPAAQRARP